MNRKIKEQHLFESETFCNIINVFLIVVFDQLKASLLNKSIHFFKNILLTPNHIFK